MNKKTIGRELVFNVNSNGSFLMPGSKISPLNGAILITEDFCVSMAKEFDWDDLALDSLSEGALSTYYLLLTKAQRKFERAVKKNWATYKANINYKANTNGDGERERYRVAIAPALFARKVDTARAFAHAYLHDGGEDKA